MAKREILKLGNRFYTVHRHERLGDHDGEWDGDAGRVEIRGDIPADAELETLVHEMFHAAWHNADLPNRTTEERAITILARAAVELFTRNPTLRTRLKKLVENDK